MHNPFEGSLELEGSLDLDPWEDTVDVTVLLTPIADARGSTGNHAVYTTGEGKQVHVLCKRRRNKKRGYRFVLEGLPVPALVPHVSIGIEFDGPEALFGYMASGRLEAPCVTYTEVAFSHLLANAIRERRVTLIVTYSIDF